MSDENVKHFVRINGKVLGPFALDQLRSLKSRGRLHSEHEVSSDRRTWRPATMLTELFEPQRPSTPEVSVLVTDSPEPSTRAVQWYYAIDDDQHGPVTYQELKGLAGRGELKHRDLIWHAGLEDWIAAGDHPGLLPTQDTSHRFASATHSVTGQSSARAQTLLWSLALDVIRENLTAMQLQRFVTTLVFAGGLGLTLSMILGFVSYATTSIRMNSVPLLFTGLAVILIGSALKYLALHSLEAGDNLIRTTPNQMSSMTSVNMAAVFLLAAGILVSSCLVYLGIYASDLKGKLSLFVWAGESLFVLGMCACFLLQTAWMNVEIVPTSRAGLEGVAILSFMLKLVARMSNLIFATSSILSAVGFGAASLVAIFTEDISESYVDLTALSMFGGLHLLLAGLVPVVAYLTFVSGSLFLDVFQNLMRPLGTSGLATPSVEGPLEGRLH